MVILEFIDSAVDGKSQNVIAEKDQIPFKSCIEGFLDCGVVKVVLDFDDEVREYSMIKGGDSNVVQE